MELGEKLQELRKSRGMTQEELAEALYVSRTAVSKWESNRGCPSIDSLKQISAYFSVTIDDLLSGEKLIFIAENENKSKIRGICDTLLAILDLLHIMLIALPLYPQTVGAYVYSVPLWLYTETAVYNKTIYLVLFTALILCGLCELLQIQLNGEKGKKIFTKLALVISLVTVLYLVVTREAYAATVAILLLLLKFMIIFKAAVKN